MDDEKPTFKVTDRRLFNADGSPRELAEEERSANAAAAPVVNSTPDTPVSQPIADSAGSAIASQAASAASGASDLDDDGFNPEEVEGAQDPASFVNFVMSIASNAAASLGMMEHPATHEREVDLELGKHWIDVLGMLQKKTRGNLSPQEQKMIDGLLSDLRMQFVSLANASQKPRSFSGRDITGGR